LALAGSRQPGAEGRRSRPESGCERLRGVQSVRQPAPQMQPAHRARLVTVREAALHPLAPQPQQALAALSSNPSAVAVHRRLFPLFSLPIPPPVIGFADIAADLQRL